MAVRRRFPHGPLGALVGARSSHRRQGDLAMRPVEQDLGVVHIPGDFFEEFIS
jgi:hypothetical protein